MTFIDKSTLADHDHFSSSSTAPARPRRYLSGGKGLLPHSCTLYVYRDAADALQFTARSLKVGSGVKAVFDKGFQLPSFAKVGRLEISLRQDHPDYEDLAKLNLPSFDEPTANVVVVQDSMETEPGLAGQCGIIESWLKCYDLLTSGRDVLVVLDNLRASGSAKADGYNVTSSGPASFAKIYVALAEHLVRCDMLSLLQMLGTLNEVILKGGHKRGIVTSMMHSECAHIESYLDSPTALLDGSHKKGVIVTKAVAKSKSYTKLRAKICEQVNTESIFLQKASEDLGPAYEGTFSNVCVGIMLPDRGTCLIWRVNVSLCLTKQELVDAFVQATKQCVSLHKIWHDEQTELHRSLWQPLEKDRQVAIDVVGLANMISALGMTYDQFMAGLRYLLAYKPGEPLPDTPAGWFAEAYTESTRVAQQLAFELNLPSFLRLHTVEPAQSHAFELTDSQGFTTCRGIWPPFDQIVNRVSESQATVTVDHGDVETVTDLGPAKVFDLNDLWQKLMNKYGLPHAISMDVYEYIDKAWLRQWWDSDLVTAYYQFAGEYDQTYARKEVEIVEIDPSCGCPLRPPVLDPSQSSECSVCAQ